MRNKILQLNVSAKDKLTQLGIFSQTKQMSQGISAFEESITTIMSQSPVNAHSFLAFLLENSRKRFYNEIDSEIRPEPKALENSNQSGLKTEMDTNKGILQKGLSSFVPNKNTEEIRSREGFKVKTFESKILPRKDFTKPSKSPLPLKSIDFRPSEDLRDDTKSGIDMSTSISRGGNLNGLKENVEVVGSSTPIQMETDGTPVKGALMKELKEKQESMALGISLNNTNISSDKSLTLMTTISSRGSSVKKVKISTSNNKKSICIEETAVIEVQLEKKESKNKDAWLKNYDILKIDYQPLPVASKKETKKLLLEKVYKELLGQNTDIKRNVKNKKTNYLSWRQKKQSESDIAKAKEVPMILNSETSRPKSLTIQSSSNVAPAKNKVNNINGNQRSLISMENMKDIVHHSISTDIFMNAVNPFYSNSVNLSSSKQNKDFSSKKPSSQKFLILPKLNINPESQSQGVFPSWPASLHNGSKSIAKGQFPLEFASRPKYEKHQKGSEKILHNLVIETKQEVMEFESPGTSLAHPLKGNWGYLNFSKNNYPSYEMNFNSVGSFNKNIGF